MWGQLLRILVYTAVQNRRNNYENKTHSAIRRAGVAGGPARFLGRDSGRAIKATDSIQRSAVDELSQPLLPHQFAVIFA